PAALISRGTVLKELGDLTDALADFDRALELTPREQAAQAYHGRGGARVLLKDFKGAIEDYDEALRIEPRFALAYLSRGHARYHRRDRRSLADYVAAFKLAPEESARELVRILVEAGGSGAAGGPADRGQHPRLGRHDVGARARRGFTLILLGRESEAVSDLELTRRVFSRIGESFDRVVALLREQALVGAEARLDLAFTAGLGG